MPTRVKICGITRWEDAQLAVELGAAALGFNFYPPSPRYVDPAAARALILKLPPLVTAVGIFANESDGEHVTRVAKESLVKAVQLHGPQFPRWEGAFHGSTPWTRSWAGQNLPPTCAPNFRGCSMSGCCVAHMPTPEFWAWTFPGPKNFRE